MPRYSQAASVGHLAQRTRTGHIDSHRRLWARGCAQRIARPAGAGPCHDDVCHGLTEFPDKSCDGCSPGHATRPGPLLAVAGATCLIVRDRAGRVRVILGPSILGTQSGMCAEVPEPIYLPVMPMSTQNWFVTQEIGSNRLTMCIRRRKALHLRSLRGKRYC
jgi:hypothetical protein